MSKELIQEKISKDVSAVEYYSNYLAETIAEMQFLDINNLKQYLSAHLNIFFSEAIADSDKGIPHLINSLAKKNEQLLIDRAEMEVQINNTRALIYERKTINQEWFNRCQYAYKMKAVELQTNNREIGRLNKIIKDANHLARVEADKHRFRQFVQFIKPLIGDEQYNSFWKQFLNKYPEYER